MCYWVLAGHGAEAETALLPHILVRMLLHSHRVAVTGTALPSIGLLHQIVSVRCGCVQLLNTRVIVLLSLLIVLVFCSTGCLLEVPLMILLLLILLLMMILLLLMISHGHWGTPAVHLVMMVLVGVAIRVKLGSLAWHRAGASTFLRRLILVYFVGDIELMVLMVSVVMG